MWLRLLGDAILGEDDADKCVGWSTRRDKLHIEGDARRIGTQP